MQLATYFERAEQLTNHELARQAEPEPDFQMEPEPSPPFDGCLDAVAVLVEMMGIPRDTATAALEACEGDVHRAAGLLTTD